MFSLGTNYTDGDNCPTSSTPAFASFGHNYSEASNVKCNDGAFPLTAFLCPHAFKVALLGDAGVGKSAWLRRILHGERPGAHHATVGMNVVTLPLATSHSRVELTVRDCGGVRSEALRGGYYVGVHGAIVMADAASPKSLQRASAWASDARRSTASALPVVLAVNKTDLVAFPHATLGDVMDGAQADLFQGIAQLSVLRDENILEPWRMLVRHLLGYASLVCLCVSPPSEAELPAPSPPPPALSAPLPLPDVLTVRKAVDSVRALAHAPLPEVATALQRLSDILREMLRNKPA